MHAVYFFKHSKHGDEELRFSLRSIRHHALAWLGPWRTPVVNGFLLHLMAALLPDLPSAYLFFCDDFVLLDDLSPALARQPRCVQDLADIRHNRGTGLFKDSLWRTHDLLHRFGFPVVNYEVHVPQYFRKRWVLAAYRDFRDFVTEDRFHGPLAQTAIMNHLRRREFTPVPLAAEGRYAGFHNRTPTADEIERGCAGKTFLNFDDDAYNPALREFLARRLPDPSPWER